MGFTFHKIRHGGILWEKSCIIGLEDVWFWQSVVKLLSKMVGRGVTALNNVAVVGVHGV